MEYLGIKPKSLSSLVNNWWFQKSADYILNWLYNSQLQLLSIFQSSTASGDLCWITLDRCCMGCNYRGRLHTGKNTFSCVWDRKGRVKIIFFFCFFSLKGRTSLQKKCKKSHLDGGWWVDGITIKSMCKCKMSVFPVAAAYPVVFTVKDIFREQMQFYDFYASRGCLLSCLLPCLASPPSPQYKQRWSADLNDGKLEATFRSLTPLQKSPSTCFLPLN